eukprot:1146279-Pelagomonas_calceolata.AAC.9
MMPVHSCSWPPQRVSLSQSRTCSNITVCGQLQWCQQRWLCSLDACGHCTSEPTVNHRSWADAYQGPICLRATSQSLPKLEVRTVRSL